MTKMELESSERTSVVDILRTGWEARSIGSVFELPKVSNNSIRQMVDALSEVKTGTEFWTGSIPFSELAEHIGKVMKTKVSIVHQKLWTSLPGLIEMRNRLAFGLVVCSIPMIATATSTRAQAEQDLGSQLSVADGVNSPPRRTMIIGIKTGETTVKSSAKSSETKLAAWFQLETASISTRYHFIDNTRGETIANNNQYQVTLKGRLQFDRKGKYSLSAGVFTGNSFNGGWNASGWGTSRGRGNLYLKQLFFSAKPTDGVELQYGGLYFEYGESTEITSYDFDGYLTGERLKLTRLRNLFFDEVSLTYGYVGDLNQPGINKRLHRLNQSNYHQFLVAKHIGERTNVSADYTFESGVDTFREAIRFRTPKLHVIDTLHFENYQRAGENTGWGFGIYGEKALRRKFTLGGGFVQIDRNGLNSDRFPRGKRLHLNGHFSLTPELSWTISFTQAIENQSASLPRTRLDLALNYNLLHTLRKAGLF